LVALCSGLTGHALGTGYYGPTEYLSGWTNLKETPEFYWETEVKRLAKDFDPKEKPALVPRTRAGDDNKVDTAPMEQATEAADTADFAAAIKDGEIKPPDTTAAVAQHGDVRTKLVTADEKTAEPLPEEFNSEFADYDRGAYAYRRGKDHWDEARKAWLGLLDRPAAERHYRTIWTAFMLGRLALKNGDPQAVEWFRKTRELAGQGFADSLGMAADSYGWEGRSELKQGHPGKAAPLFLTQLALGDESAVVSLKALIPDRDDVDGMLNYGENGEEIYPKEYEPGGPPQQPTEEQKKAEEARTIKRLAALKAAAADPLLRRLETAHILATESGAAQWYRGDTLMGAVRSANWIKVIEAARPGKVEDAEYLGWVAYTTGNYKQAQRWLDLSAGQTPAANWLRAKLELRAGKAKEAAASMEQAWEGIQIPATTGSDQRALAEASIYVVSPDDGSFSMEEWASGDMGAVRLLRSDFVQALDTFLKGGLRNDAAYVAERVLTADELKAYVGKMPPAPAAKPDDASGRAQDDTTWLRYLLGRRLVREDRYAEAGPYLPPAYGKLLVKYVEALKNGADSKLPKASRAAAWSTAAWLARNDGMELMGTEVSPDGFDTEGAFEDTDLASYRIQGVYPSNVSGTNTTIRMPFRPAKTEVERLKKNQIRPDLRYHYRIIAATLAVRAAALLEDNTEELADALNTAGLWVKDRDEKLGDRYYQIIEKRCGKTKIGREVIAKHWFVEETGPWSVPLDAAEDALHKELGIQGPG
jgi:hypothetical protein